MDRINKFQYTSSEIGAFKECFNNLKNLISEDQLNEFGLIKTDEERVRFVQKLIPQNFNFPIEVTKNGKNLDLAKEFKQKGNKEFGKNDNKSALDSYSKSIIATPYTEGHDSELAITLANRSAALYHLQEYESALNDINLVLELPYPKELKYKVLDRKARCHLALNNHPAAMAEFRNTLQALDDSKLPTEKKLKMQTDIQIMLGIMARPKTKTGHINAFLQNPKKQAKREEPKAKLCSNKNKIFEAACDKIEVLKNNELGRYVSAVEDLNAGDTVIIEKAFCTALLAEHGLTHCTNCFKRTTVPYPCRNCSSIIFCSADCRNAAENSYHKHECPILNSIYNSGASVMVLMALRMITQKPLAFFLEIKNKLEEKPGINNRKYKSSDYLSAYHLVRHEDQRQRNDFFERTVMAIFLLNCLKKTNYFENSKDEVITDEEYFITSLILRHLQLLQFNGHEIYELEIASTGKIDESRSVFIGGGLFPTLALFNHSCDPGTIRYFNGTTVIVRTIKPIRRGEMIPENYGPMFTLTKKQERQEKLKSQYWFDCTCLACIENYPTFSEMDKKILRFRCDARKEDGGKFNICNNAVAVPVDTEQFLIPCQLCGQSTNVFKGLKVLQDTDAMFKQASRDMDKGNYQAALGIYLEILTLLDSVMKPPFPDYHICQQAIRKCMLTLGNKHVKE